MPLKDIAESEKLSHIAITKHMTTIRRLEQACTKPAPNTGAVEICLTDKASLSRHNRNNL